MNIVAWIKRNRTAVISALVLVVCAVYLATANNYHQRKMDDWHAFVIQQGLNTAARATAEQVQLDQYIARLKQTPAPTLYPVRFGATDVCFPQRVGAQCADGSLSSATGAGACSYHGGVSYWLIGC